VITHYRPLITFLICILSCLLIDHFAFVGSKYGIFSILQSISYTQMSICRYGNLVLACDIAENHSPDYVSKCLSTSGGGILSRGDYVLHSAFMRLSDGDELVILACFVHYSTY